MATNTLTIAYELQDVLAGLRRCHGKTHGETRLHDLAKQLVEKIIAMQPAPEAWHAQFAPDVAWTQASLKIVDALVVAKTPLSFEKLVKCYRPSNGRPYALVKSATRKQLERTRTQIAEGGATFSIVLCNGLLRTVTSAVQSLKPAD